MHIKILIPVVLPLLASACAGPEHLGPDFGNSYRINTTVQLQDPEAETRRRALATSDGQKIEQALKDYRADKAMEARDHLIVESGK
jgi:hypothetical protein